MPSRLGTAPLAEEALILGGRRGACAPWRSGRPVATCARRLRRSRSSARGRWYGGCGVRPGSVTREPRRRAARGALRRGHRRRRPAGADDRASPPGPWTSGSPCWGAPSEPAAPMAPRGWCEGDWHDAGRRGALGAGGGRGDPGERVRRRGRARGRRRPPARPCGPAPRRWPGAGQGAPEGAAAPRPACRWPPFLVLREHAREIAAAGRDLGWPLMLKARALGYDGYGNATCADARGGAAGRVRPPGRRRGRAGRGASSPSSASWPSWWPARRAARPPAYPVVETRAARPRLPRGRSPPPRSPARRARPRPRGRRRGREAAERPRRDRRRAVPGRGRRDPGQRARAAAAQLRPLHDRGLRDLAVREPPARRARPAAGRVALRAPAAAMVNLLGTATGRARRRTCAAALAVAGAHVHLYGKAEVRPRRKMGHVTALGGHPGRARWPARAAAAAAVAAVSSPAAARRRRDGQRQRPARGGRRGRRAGASSAWPTRCASSRPTARPST